MNATDLRVGDKLRLTHVPKADLADRDTIPTEDADMLPTATVLENLTAARQIVTVHEVDEWGRPWFDAEIFWQGEMQYHSIAILDDQSWELVSLQD